MPRYERTRINRSKITSVRRQSVLKYNTTLYEQVPESNDDIYIIAQEGDRLDNLAQQFYGNPFLWWFIAQTNKINTMNVPAGTSLRISTHLEYAIGD